MGHSRTGLLRGRAAKVVDGRTDDWTGSSTYIGGETTVSSGEFVYQDYLFDDTGKDSGMGPLNDRGTYRGLAPTAGNYAYPIEALPTRCGTNCADLLEFRAALRGDRVYFLARLNTLLAPGTTVVGITLGRTRTRRRSCTSGPLTRTSPRPAPATS